MKSDFSQPQRQSLVGVVVMFTDTLQGMLRALWPFLIVWIFKLDQINKTYLGLAMAAVAVLVSVIAYLKYLNFTFFLDEENEEFVVRKGVLNKSRIAIPLDKIQQVNINQSLIQRVIGVHALEVDTAGSSKKEVAIKAITHHLALQLKERLLEGGTTTASGTAEDSYTPKVADRPFIQISFISLLKTGITSNYVRSFALLLAFVITIYQNIIEYLQVTDSDENPFASINSELVLSFITFIIIGIMVLTVLVNLSRTIIRYYNFRITKQQNALLLSYGLLNTKSTIIRPERVQSVTVGRNYFQRKMDVQDLKIKQASDLEMADKNRGKSAMEIPGCSEAEKDVLLRFLLDEIPEKGIALKPNFRKIIGKIIGALLIPLGLYFILAELFFPDLYDVILFTPFYTLFVLLIIYFGFRNYRLYVNDNFIIKQSGAWDVDNEFLAPHKIQAISVTQYFWHKYSNIGLVTLYTAGGKLTFGLADFTKLKEYVNYWLYQVETTNKDWM